MEVKSTISLHPEQEHYCSICRQNRLCRYWDSELARIPSHGGWICDECIDSMVAAEKELKLAR